MNSLSDIGNLMYLYLDEIEPGKATDACEFSIKATASLVKQKGGRNWIPIIVKETGKDKYQVIGNSFIYAVAQEAGLERVWCIIADGSDDTLKVTQFLAGEDIPKINLALASRDEIRAALEYLAEKNLLKGVKIAIAVNRIDEAPRQNWKTLEPIVNLKCGIGKGAKLDALKQVFFLNSQSVVDVNTDIPKIIPAKTTGEKQDDVVQIQSKSSLVTRSVADVNTDAKILKTKTLKDLQAMAKQRGIIGFSKMKKDALVQALA